MKITRLFTICTIIILVLGMANQVIAQSYPDSDRDGIPDHLDGCKDQPGPRTNNGCPLSTAEPPSRGHDIPSDSDGDGTADPLDKCPDMPGDGANGGCPDGVDPNNPQNPAITTLVQLNPPPPSDFCIASPDGTFGVNMRADPNPYSPVLHVLEVNEWAQVLFVAHEGKNPFGAEHEFANMMLPFGFTFGPPDPDPDPDPEYDPNALWLFIMTDDFQLGWIAEELARFGGDCADFDELNSDPDYLDVLILPNGDDGVGFPGVDPVLVFPIFPDPPPGFQFEIHFPGEDNDETFDFAAECMLVELSSAAWILECVDGSTPIFKYCLMQPGSEAGIFEEVCYEVEIPDGCTIETPEAGVWKVTCEEDSEVIVTPFGSDSPMFVAKQFPQGVAMLLPAVQGAREAANQ